MFCSFVIILLLLPLLLVTMLMAQISEAAIFSSSAAVCKWPSFFSTTAGSVTTVTFAEGSSQQQPTTISSSTPFQKKNKVISRFSVLLEIKKQKTAIGLQFTKTPVKTYLTPTYSATFNNYISMGGAGFIYPGTRSSGSRYGEGDKVTIDLNWDTREATFSVNDRSVGTQKIDASINLDVAWPSISSEGGLVVCKVNTEEIST